MGWRDITASWFAESEDTQAEGVSSNMKLLVISAAFLIVTIGLILMQPGRAPQQVAQTDQTINAPTAALLSEQSTQSEASPQASEVTRSSASLLTLSDTNLDGDVSKMLRSPIRLGGQTNDLRQMTKTALAGFGHTAGPGDALYGMLVQALAEGQSNAYIDALLNTAAGRGEIMVPVALQTATGRLDTNTLLQGLASLVVQ